MTKETKAMTKQETSAIQEYGDWTPEQIKKETKEIGSGSEFWTAPVGRSTVRFLPPKVGWPSPFVIQHQHFIRLPTSDRPVVFCCPKEHEGKRCLACEKADKMEVSGNKRDMEGAKKLRPQRRIMANVIIDPTEPVQKVSIWTFGKTVYDQLKSIRSDDENGGNFLDPVKGFNLVVNRVGTGKDDTRYTVIPARGTSQLANMDWLATQRDLRKLTKIPSVEQQERLIAGEDPRDVWGDGEDAGMRRDRNSSPKDANGKDVIDVDDGKRTAEDDLFDDEVDLD